MRAHVGGHAVEITRPESAKFHHPLLLLHGLWTDVWVWAPFASYLAHRGWESWAPSLPGVGGARAAGVVEALVRALPAPPVIVAHDVGVLGAIAAACRAPVVALVAIAPLMPPAAIGTGRGLFAWPRFWRARLAGARVPPPRGAGARAFLGAAIGHRGELRADSAVAFREIAAGRTRLPPRVDAPGLVLGGDRDVIVPDAALRATAARFGWARRSYPGRGHFAMLEPGWEALADDVHRWIVQTIGADLLALLDDEDQL